MTTINIESIIQLKTLDQSVKEQIILYKGEAYVFFDTGNTRFVFANKDKTKVIKILIEEHLKDYNQEEFDIYTNALTEVKNQLAKTGINGRIIEQEFCNPIKFDDRKLSIKQHRFASRCRNEVGWTVDDRLVCFDLDEFLKY